MIVRDRASLLASSNYRGAYLVRVGRYDTYARARRALGRAREIEPQAFVVP